MWTWSERPGEECWRRSDVLEWNLNWLTPGGLWHLTELLLGAIDPDAELIMECDVTEERKSSATDTSGFQPITGGKT